MQHSLSKFNLILIFILINISLIIIFQFHHLNLKFINLYFN